MGYVRVFDLLSSFRDRASSRRARPSIRPKSAAVKSSDGSRTCPRTALRLSRGLPAVVPIAFCFLFTLTPIGGCTLRGG